MRTKIHLPKSDPVAMKKIARYSYRHGCSAEEAWDTISLMTYSAPKHPEKKLAAAMELEGMNRTCVKMAREGYWSDFKTPLEYPKVELVKLLREGGRHALADRVEKGEFDG